MHKKIVFCLVLAFMALVSTAQTVKELNTRGKLSFRGLSVVDDSTVWVAGSQGTVGKSINGGRTWEWIVVKEYEKCEFRDIEAFSKDVAIIMAIAEPAYLLKTIDGGKTWRKVYENKTKGMFLDAMDFKDDRNGIVVGDPINGQFFLARTNDGGESWIELGPKNNCFADSLEACFASSGTNIRVVDHDQFVFISGGSTSSLLKAGIMPQSKEEGSSDNYSKIMFLREKIKLPILQGTSSTGANSIAIKNWKTFIVVGGDFTNTEAGPNCVLTNDAGKTWTFPQKSPLGYKSCVEYLYGDTWICCGLTGVDISTDNGKTWKQISAISYHACRKAKNGKTVYLSGNEGRIGKVIFE